MRMRSHILKNPGGGISDGGNSKCKDVEDGRNSVLEHDEW